MSHMYLNLFRVELYIIMVCRQAFVPTNKLVVFFLPFQIGFNGNMGNVPLGSPIEDTELKPAQLRKIIEDIRSGRYKKKASN